LPVLVPCLGLELSLVTTPTHEHKGKGSHGERWRTNLATTSAAHTADNEGGLESGEKPTLPQHVQQTRRTKPKHRKATKVRMAKTKSAVPSLVVST
jgi:hypothetical protein